MIELHIFVLVGKSGTGKSTLQQRSRLKIPTSITTRNPRDGEKSYLFLSNSEYFDMAKSGQIAFPNQVYTNWYGILKSDLLEEPTCVVLDAVGLRQAQESFGFENVTGIMVDVPQSLLNMRMHKRGSSKEEIKERMDRDNNKFKGIYHLCDYKITNDMDISDGVFELHSIIKEVLEGKC